MNKFYAGIIVILLCVSSVIILMGNPHFFSIITGYSASDSNSENSSEWKMFGRTLDNNRYYPYSSSDDISQNVIAYWATNPVRSSPAVSDGYVYVGGLSDYVYQLNDTTMGFVNGYATGTYFYSSPAVANGYVYIGGDDGIVYQFNASTMAPVNNYTTGNIVRSSPAVANEYVYVGSDDGRAYRLGAGVGGGGPSGSSGSNSTVSFNITEEVSIIVNQSVDFGSGRVSPNASFAVLDSDAGTVVNGTWTPVNQSFYIENDGTVNISINYTANKNADQFLGGTGPSFMIKGYYI